MLNARLNNKIYLKAIISTVVSFQVKLNAIVKIGEDVQNLIFQENVIEIPDGIRTEFTISNKWKEGQIKVYVNGVEQLNGIDVDIVSKRLQKTIIFLNEPPLANSKVWVSYVIEK